MMVNGSTHRSRIRAAVLIPALCAALGAAGKPAAARPADHHAHPLVLGAPAMPPAGADTAQPLPRVEGTVEVRPRLSVRPRTPAVDRTVGAAAPRVALRALVIGVDADDWGVATWRSTLDRVGVAYDVLYSRTTALTASTLVRPDAVGRYNAILLSNSMLLHHSGAGLVSGLDPTEWNTLWAYERDFAVRQATLYASYGTWPENYCLSGSREGGVHSTPLPASLTAAGAGVFDYLQSTATVPIVESYVYRNRLTPGCSADPILVNGDDVLGVRTTSTDGRERIAVTFTSDQYLTQANLLVYGLFRWASRGLYLGEQRHFLNVDIDDWFNTADHYHPDGQVETDPGYRVSGHDMYNLAQQQTALRARHPLAGDFTLNLAYNGGDADLTADDTCSPSGGVDTLTATSRCLASTFRWINHTLNHPELNRTDYATSYDEIAGNRTVAATLGINQPDNVLKTGEYSGLGVYNPDPADDIGPPTDYGLNASNADFLAAARDLGVEYVHGNMSFGSHVPSCFNCGVVHPLEPSIMIVPDWPTNIAYHTTLPAEQTAFYNSYYGPGGRFPYWPTDLTYTEMLDYEAGVALSHVSSGSVYTHTFHIANVRDDGTGNTLVTDWLDRVFTMYSAYYSVPILNPDWPSLALYAANRNRHFAQLAANADAVYDPDTATITVTSPLAGSVTVSGATAAGHSTYGTDVASSVTLTAGGSTSVPASPRP